MIPAVASSYYRATERQRPRSDVLPGSLSVDVAVVGGGLVGLSTALHLARQGVNVCVIEQGELGLGASGRNGGQVHVGMRRDQWWLERNLGVAAAQRLWELAIAAREHLDWLIREYAIECDFQPGLIAVNHKASFDADACAYVAHLQQQYQYASIEYWDRQTMAGVLHAAGYFGGTYDRRGGHLHPLNLTLGIARAAQQAGAALYTDLPVLKLHTRPKIKEIVTPLGVIKAKHVVLAANGYLNNLEARVARRVMPINNFIVTTAPLGAKAGELIANNAAVADSRFVVNYFRLTPDNRLLFGGGENYSYRFPQDIGAFVRPHLERVFPSLKDVPFDYAWGGTLGITPKRLPLIRELDPGFINASGFSGLGVMLGPTVGRVVAQALMGDRDVFAMLTRLPAPVFPGGQWFRTPALVAAMLFYALRDRL